MICFGRYRLDPVQGLTAGSEEVRVTARSLAVLRYLADRAGQVVTKEELFRGVWVDTAVSDAALTSCIKELRRALEDDARKPTYIETLHRRGYRFLPAVSAVETDAPTVADQCIVGRRAVIDDLLRAFARASAGARQLVLISGDPGIGKSTVVRAAAARIASSPSARITWGQCVEHHGVGEPYAPLLEALTRLARHAGGRQVVAALEQCAPTWLAQIPELRPSGPGNAPVAAPQAVTPARMQRELTGALEALAAERPLVLYLEDLQWCDVSTLDWIATFARRPDRARVLVIGTVRPAALSGTDPLASIGGELAVKGLCREIPLRGLEAADVAEYISRRFPAASGAAGDLAALAAVVHRHTEGNPLFVEVVLGDLAARGLLAREGAGWRLAKPAARIELGIPDDLRRMIESQADRLEADERAVLDGASVCGHAFSSAAVAAGVKMSVGDAEAVLARLARRHQFVRAWAPVEWPDGTVASGFEFLHALYRGVVYDALPAGRRADLHRRVGTRLETAFGDRVRGIAAELSRHFDEARESHKALTYLQHAAEYARSRSAFPEAQLHYTRALARLEGADVADRLEREIVLRTGLGGVVMATEGWGSPNAETAFSRARRLCQELNDPSRLFPALWGLWLYYWGRGPLSTAHDLAGQLLDLASSDDPSTLLQAHHALWATEFSLGHLDRAVHHARNGLALYDGLRDAPLAGTFGNHDAGVCGRLFLARALSLQGAATSAASVADEAVAAARALDHAFTLTLAHVFSAAVFQSLRDPERARAHAVEAAAMARDHDFRLLLAWATAFEGSARSDAGDHAAGIDMLFKAFGQVRGTGSEQFLPHVLGLLADACLTAGRVDDAATAVRDAFGAVERTGERFYEAELRRLEGDVARARGADDGAAAAYRAALHVASSQGAHLLRLRAALRLASLWRDRGDVTEADRLVSDARAALPEPGAFPGSG